MLSRTLSTIKNEHFSVKWLFNNTFLLGHWRKSIIIYLKQITALLYDQKAKQNLSPKMAEIIHFKESHFVKKPKTEVCNINKTFHAFLVRTFIYFMFFMKLETKWLN